MEIYSGKYVASQKEATSQAFQVAGIDTISPDILDMFRSIPENGKISSEADKIIGSVVKSRCGSKTTWRADRWFVPILRLQYQGKDIPQLTIEINTYFVAVVTVRTQDDSRYLTLIGSIGKPEILTVPMIFLYAVLEKDLRRFSMVARDSVYTTWEIPGFKPFRLPNDFIIELKEMLNWRSVVAWLECFGAQGRCIAPLIAGSLLGLAFQDSSQPVLVNRQGFTTEDLVSALESMAYRPAEAREMVGLSAARLRADMTLEEAIRITLQMRKGDEK